MLSILSLWTLAQALDFEYLPITGDPPPKRLYNTFCSIESLNLLLNFGGQTESSMHYNDLWIIDATELRWKHEISPTLVNPGTLLYSPTLLARLLYYKKHRTVVYFWWSQPIRALERRVVLQYQSASGRTYLVDKPYHQWRSSLATVPLRLYSVRGR